MNLKKTLTGVAYRVCLANENETVKVKVTTVSK